MKKTVRFTDTTLRDGEQSPGTSFSPEDKIRLMECLDDAGLYQIDAGIPAMGSREKDTMIRMMERRKRIKVSAWNRMNPKDISHAMDVGPDVIHISVPASDRLIYNVLKKDREWVIRTLKSCVSMAKDNGYEVSAGFQDASRADIPFMILLANCLDAFQVSMVKLADTVGILTPPSVRHLAGQMVKHVSIPLGIHTHNDLGMAVPIAIAAVKAGILYVDTTCFGIGERAGNCDLFTFSKCAAPIITPDPTLLNIDNLRTQAAGILFAKHGARAWNDASM